MNVLIVEGRYHAQVADALADGATAALVQGGARFERVSVPGALEIPPAIAMAIKSRRFDGYVALGSVVREAGLHFDLIARESAAGLMRLASGHGLALGNGIVVAERETDALRLAGEGDAGGDAARACLSLMTLWSRLGMLS